MSYHIQKILMSPDGNSLHSSETIPDAFLKINSNYDQIKVYIDGQVSNSFGNISITSLTEVKANPFTGSIPFVESHNDIRFRMFGSDSALDPSLSDSIDIDTTTIPGLILLRSAASSVPPPGSSHIDMQQNFILNIGDITQANVDQYNLDYSTSYSIDDFIPNKRFNDLTYYIRGNPVILSSGHNFELHITGYSGGYAIVNNHGLDSSFNGTKVVFSAVNNVPSMLTNNNVYYLRYYNDNRLALYNNKENASTQNSSIADSTRISLSGFPSGSDHYLTFSDYDSSLPGGYLSTQAVPRSDIVLRSGDKMSGDLILNDHPSPYQGDSQTDNDLIAASKYYVNQVCSAMISEGSLDGPSSVNFNENDILVATGLYRAIVSSFDSSQWSIGDSFSVQGSTQKNGVVVDILPVDGPSNYHVITYSKGTLELEKSDILTNGTGTATVVQSNDELAQSEISSDSHISLEVTRNDGAEFNSSNPVSSSELIIKDGVITTEMLSDTFMISTEHIDLPLSILFNEVNPLNGWNSDPSHKRENVGMSSFSDLNFDVDNGFVRVKQHGISYNELPNVPDNTVLGTGTGEGGIIRSITFEDIFTIGGAITENNLDTMVFNKFDQNIFLYENDILTIRDNGIVLTHLNNINSGYVLGRTSSGFGNVEVISLEDLGVGGISQDDLSPEFTFTSDKLHLSDNSIALNKFEKIPPMTVLGNSWTTMSDVQTLPLSKNHDPDTVAMRKSNGALSCSELQLVNNMVLKTTIDSLKAYTPTGQLIFTSLCGDTCDFDKTETHFNGSVSADEFTETSDETFKTDIETITHALSLVQKLRGVSFKWISNNENSIGLIAQEVEQVIPEVVKTDKNGNKSVSYTSLIGVLVEAIKDISSSLECAVDEDYDIGTVLVIGDNDNLETTSIKSDSKVAGVVMYSSKGHVQLYGKGKAKCKVLGKVNKGDLLVTSAIPGYAIVDNRCTFDKCIGKSMVNKETYIKDVIDIII